MTSAPLDAAQRALLTRRGQTMGTVAYMSPEQVRGEELDGRTDIFSFGVVIYEMVAGRRPFQGATSGVIFDGILNKTPAPITEINPAAPAELVHVLNKALEKDRELRYQSARELRADLARMKRDTSSTGATATVPAVSSTTPARSRRRLLVPVVLGTSAALCAVAGHLWWSRPEPASPPVNTPTKLTRVTFEEGLQAEPTWSPDSRFIAYSANTAGNFDIWVQPLGGGRAVQVTTDPAVDWQPAWSPDGNSLAFRSERDAAGSSSSPRLAAVNADWPASGTARYGRVMDRRFSSSAARRSGVQRRSSRMCFCSTRPMAPQRGSLKRNWGSSGTSAPSSGTPTAGGFLSSVGTTRALDSGRSRS
jgi:serine/threonine protein kinase